MSVAQNWKPNDKEPTVSSMLQEDFRQVARLYFLPLTYLAKGFYYTIKMARKYSRNTLD